MGPTLTSGNGPGTTSPSPPLGKALAGAGWMLDKPVLVCAGTLTAWAAACGAEPMPCFTYCYKQPQDAAP